MELDSDFGRAARDFVLARHRGVLVTQKRDGRPQLSNIAYAMDTGGIVRISVTSDRAKTANLRRDERASLYVARDDFWAYVVLEGRGDLSPVTSHPGDDTGRELADLYRAVQGEHPDWDDFHAAMVRDRRLVVRFHAESAYGMLP